MVNVKYIQGVSEDIDKLLKISMKNKKLKEKDERNESF